jgi:hypothetical protein
VNNPKVVGSNPTVDAGGAVGSTSRRHDLLPKQHPQRLPLLGEDGVWWFILPPSIVATLPLLPPPARSQVKIWLHRRKHAG